jgi:hypothetical protein
MREGIRPSFVWGARVAAVVLAFLLASGVASAVLGLNDVVNPKDSPIPFLIQMVSVPVLSGLMTVVLAEVLGLLRRIILAI